MSWSQEPAKQEPSVEWTIAPDLSRDGGKFVNLIYKRHTAVVEALKIRTPANVGRVIQTKALIRLEGVPLNVAADFPQDQPVISKMHVDGIGPVQMYQHGWKKDGILMQYTSSGFCAIVQIWRYGKWPLSKICEERL
ncbi:MAG: hypothetical protein ABSE48_19280 [Verrucomicrobiota bacterium]|jgi:hypothetical protein